MEIPAYEEYVVVQPPNSRDVWDTFHESRGRHGVLFLLLHKAGMETPDDDFWLSFRVVSSYLQRNGTVALHGNTLLEPSSVVVAQISADDEEAATVIIISATDDHPAIDEVL